MKMLVFAAAAAFTAFAAPAYAQNAYVGAGYTHLEADGSDDVSAITGRLGYNFTPYLGVEGEASFGDDLDGAYGAYGVVRAPLNNQFTVHGRIGYHNTEFDGGGEADGVAYGVGASWNFTPSLAVRGDYTRLDGDDEADAFGVGLQLSF